MPRIDPSPDLLRLAAEQDGVITTEQATRCGLGRHPVTRLLATGRWRRLDRGLYFTHDEEPPWPSFAWGGVLLGGDHARIGGPAAAYLAGLFPSPPDRITVLVPEQRVMTSRFPWIFERERAGVRSPARFGSPPRISVEDLVLDLCQDADVPRVIDLVTTAVQTRRTKVPRLRQALRQRQRVRHRRLIEHLLADVAEGAETPLELVYLRDVERAHGLPRGRRQQHRHDARSGIRDVVYEEFDLVVELDGRVGHDGLGRFRDMRRDNGATVAGEATLRYRWSDVRGRPCSVSRQVDGVLSTRGWRGLLRPCTRCRLEGRCA